MRTEVRAPSGALPATGCLGVGVSVLPSWSYPLGSHEFRTAQQPPVVLAADEGCGCATVPAVVVRRLAVWLGFLVVVAGVGLPLAGAASVHKGAAGSAVDPGPGAESPGEHVEGLIAKVTAAQKALHTLRANFRETKRGCLFLHPIVSTGVFSFLAPDSARWDYESPRRMTVIFRHNVLSTYDAATGGIQRLHVGQRQRRLVRFLTGTQPLDRLLENFRVTLSDAGPHTPFVLQLDPEGPAIRRKLKHIRIDIDRTSYLPVRLELVDGNGDTTVYELSAIEINPKLSPDLFKHAGRPVPGGGPHPQPRRR